LSEEIIMRKTTEILMKTKLMLAMSLFVLPALACGSSNNSNTDANNTDAGIADGGSTPAPPTLGAQVDRQGRSVVNTALIHPFDSNAAAKGAAKDAYNAAAPATWQTFKAEIAHNLAIFDGLDGNCGNQLLAGPTVVAGRYDGLAGALADDQLFVNSAVGACTQYFAVELGMTTDCGGRAPTYDTVDVTLSAAAIGMASGVTDGIAADDKTQSNSVFPFLAD
jgi:hypothetical protein